MVGAALLLLGAGSLGAEEPDRVGDLAWLSGSWANEDEGRWTEEHWTAPRGQLMLGVGRSGAANRPVGFEYLRIQPDEDGTPVYFAAPGGGEATAFRLVTVDSTMAVFENPDHDYPQRIRYRREGSQLFAEISAIDGSNAIGWTLTLTD